MEEMRGRTKTVVVVSHSPAQIKALCSRVVWLEKGKLLMDGSIEDILPVYKRFCKNPDQWLTEHPETADLLI
jgi:ABC-type polysaccharide/polyol phosphate transport system ATPase subunit